MSIHHILSKWSESSLVLRILAGLMVGAVLGLVVPQLTGIVTATAEFYDRKKKKQA